MTTFDTLAAARDLEAAGFDRKQAEAVAAAIRGGQGDFATKQDIDTLRAEMGALRGEMRAELNALKWIVGFIAALQIGMALRLFGAF